MTSLLIKVYEECIPGILDISFNPTFNYSIDECGAALYDENHAINSLLDFTLGERQPHDTHLESLEHKGSIAYLKESNAIDSVELSEPDDDNGTIEIMFNFSADTPKQELLNINFSILMALNLAGHSLVTGTFIYDELEFLTSLKDKKLQLIYIGANGSEL
jgi:hypothetical protein